MKKFRFEIVDAEGYRSGITLAASDTQQAFEKCHTLLKEDDDIVTFEILD